MSRIIDLEQPLSDEDKQYLVERGQEILIARNEAFLTGREFSMDDHAVDPLEVYSLENATETPAPVVEEAPVDEEVADEAITE